MGIGIRQEDKMKIKIFILTYRNPADLNGGLEYMFNSTAVSQTKHQIKLNVINNHTEFSISPDYAPYVTVYHNPLQPNFGTGHNSRNWNQALMLGFENLNNPKSDLVITAHDDTWWGKNWLELTEQALEMGYTYISYGLGDNIQVWTPQAVKRIGLWDERYCTLAFAEHDYFFKAACYNGDKSSINDKWHARTEPDGRQVKHYEWNPLPFRDDVLNRPPVNQERQNQINYRKPTAYLGRELFMQKWGVAPERTSIQEMLDKGIRMPNVSTYMYYPYFENAIETMAEQNYLGQTPYAI
jgi:hypothetical protein